ncbi:bifunctional DnaQ family exonuclease/ATP-dependent helicase [Streptococcus marimammalium]|uniref:bifunctional DnaQ family exonuclease/ATP-dependent helicase n=1 Tax=Streptococcus marimammalium TaxID=269666 RepID=UPI00036E9A70|nr:bifunctional DnaQ family exonuclease/ATP-dependent helicase [Streptococcus marimammalium]
MKEEIKKPRYAVVDLEATSAGTIASIIQVGIVIIEDDIIIKTYETDINPHERLDDHIVALTGLTDERLSRAPEFSQVAKEIFELLEHCIFVAHNVKFDANLLAEQLFLEGYELMTPRVDTVELTQIFYPTLEKYSLPILAKSLSLNLANAHTAISDAIATAELFLKLRSKMRQLPKRTLEKIVSFGDSLLFESQLVIKEILAEKSSYDDKDFIRVADILLKKDQAMAKPKHLSHDFDTNCHYLGLDERPIQSQFAQLIEKRFDEPTTSFIEAQAGIGKTYGYLLTLLPRLDGKQLLISVPTKVLQDQIVVNEGQNIKEAFNIDCQSIKSPQNYLKLDVFYQTLHRQDHNRLINRYKMQLLVWLLETDTGDLDEVKQKQRFEAYFDEIKHDGYIDTLSPFFNVDFWRKIEKNYHKKSIIITNHAYLLARLEHDKSFLENKVLVIDEAQKFFLALERTSQKKVNVTKILQIIHKKLQQEPPLILQRLLESLQFELSHLVEDFYKKKRVLLKEEQLIQLKQDISEYPDNDLDKLKELLFGSLTVFWLESEQLETHRDTYLRGGQTDFRRFQEYLSPKTKTYAISATLSISKKVNLADLLGFDEVTFDYLPVDVSLNQKIWLDKEAEPYEKTNLASYEALLVKKIVSLSRKNVPMLVLFTSKQVMLSVSERLEEHHIKHLTQYKNGLASNIKRRFDNGESKVLLGTGSFWEGVDFTSQDKMIAVITRLPFDNPEDFFTKKMASYLRDNKKNPFYDYTLPVAILKLKQAIGRTNRRQTQRSAVIILDNRVVTKRYGKQIRHALTKQSPVREENFEEILSELSDFLL